MKTLVFKTLAAVLVIALGVWAEDNVAYIDENGASQTQNGVTVIDASNIASIGNLNGWYLVRGTITHDERLMVSGTAHIILEDGSDLTVRGIYVSTLTIYAQSTGSDMGKLAATNGTLNGAGIQNNSIPGNGITINGGTVTARGGIGGAGIGGGGSTLYDAGSGGTITINGGTVTATGGSYAAGIGGGGSNERGYGGGGGTITINGGTVTATGGSYAAGIGGGGSYRNNNSFNNAGNGGIITINGGTVTARGGKVMSVGGSTLYEGGIGGGGDGDRQIGAAGTFTLNGNAVVFTDKVSDTDESRRTGGILFIGTTGTFYGSSVTISENITIPETYTLVVPESSALTVASGATLTNEGTLTNNGTVTPADGSTIIITGIVDGSNKIIGANTLPSVSSKTPTSITLGGASDLLAATGQELEYAISEEDDIAGIIGDWQAATTFANLTEGTTYWVFARSKENTHFAEGAVSQISAKTALTIADLDFEIPTGHIYTGTSQGIGNVTAKVAGFGQITVLYNGSAIVPVNAGTYAITASVAKADGAGEVATELGSYVIAKKSVTVTADAKTKVYGSPDPELTYSAEPTLVSGDNFSGSLSRAEGDNVGDYAISQGTLTAGNNYSVTFVGANFAITAPPPPPPCEEGYERNESGECVPIETPSSSSADTPSSSSSSNVSSSSSESTPIRLPQIATVNQATQIYNGVNLQATNGAMVEIYSLKGDLINKQKFGSGVYTVSFGHLPKGMYIVKATFGGGKQVLKVPVR